MGVWNAKQTKILFVGSDYVFPLCQPRSSTPTRQPGRQVGGREYLPLGSGDAEPIVRKIAAANPDIILNTINGDSNVAFFRAAAACRHHAGQDSDDLVQHRRKRTATNGPRDSPGDLAGWNYFYTVESPENQAFRERLYKKFGPSRVATDPMAAAYVAVHLWAQAVRSAGSADPQAVRKAIAGQAMRGPEGPVKIDLKNGHAHRIFRVGRANPDGLFDIVHSSVTPIAPEPFPMTRSPAEWQKLLDDLQRQWNGQWAKPVK